MTRPRAGLVIVAALVALMAAAAAAQQRWYELYDQAIDHIKRGEWQQAESKLHEAQKAGPAPGRNVLRYGMMRGNFFPDFYLGVVFLNTNRPAEALRAFALARAQKINPQDSAFQTIAEMENQARIDEKRFADAAAMPTGSAKPAVEPAAERPRVDTEKPVSATSPVEHKAPDTPAPAKTDRERNRDSAERDAMQLFFAGEYRKAVATLEGAERDSAMRLSARGYFYRACALAALALRSSSPDTKLLEEARRHYAESIRDTPTALPDRRYVSPRILLALGS